ncbi:hypothetical protein HN51_061953 [Arachis hypogaea]
MQSPARTLACGSFACKCKGCNHWRRIDGLWNSNSKRFAYTLICTGVFMCVVTCLGHMAAGEIKHSQAAHVTNLWRDFSSELIVGKIKCF